MLRQIGIEPVVVPADIDEAETVRTQESETGPVSATEMVSLLAQRKAETISTKKLEGKPLDGFILGGDSAFELDGVIYGKPHTREVAKSRWLLQRGRTGILHSGQWLIDHRSGKKNGAVGATASATVEFEKNISEAEIDAYISSGEPLSVAGAFTLDGLAAPFIRRIEGAPSAVIGLSLPVVRELFTALGVVWTDLWAHKSHPAL